MTDPEASYGPTPIGGWSDALIDAKLRSEAAGSVLDGDPLQPEEIALIRRKLRGEITDGQFQQIALARALATQERNRS